MVIVLAAVGVISGGGLAKVYRWAAPLIEQQRLKRLKEAIFAVLPQAEDYRAEERKGLIIYRGLDGEGNPVGIALEVEGPGFQGKIRLMIGLDNQLERLLGIEVLDSLETPGLGGKIADQEFKDQFQGLAVRPKIIYVRNRDPATPRRPGEIDAITGATISSAAVVDMINEGIARVREQGSGKNFPLPWRERVQGERE
ncbi:RnfABCDGE type electron transport complex subunit G [candidate division NPL-UPA2 bacterium]|nr:RnfABCDGE type electron transport complex subunit G [candidate division NPL-UPA2 bacterium]